MLQPQPSQALPGANRREAEPSPMFGALDCVLTDGPSTFAFDGAISRREANAVWAWLRRDVAPDLIEPLAGKPLAEAQGGLAAVSPAVLSRARAAIEAAVPGSDMERRLRIQLGGTADTWHRLPTILNAVKYAPFLERAKGFGRAANGIEDGDTLVAALQSMPRQDPGVAALLMMAALGQVAVPSRLVVAASQIAAGTSEISIVRAGFAPLVDAILAHAQNALSPMLQTGAFADVDLVCRALERFHRLIRAISGYLELQRPGRWLPVIGGLAKTVSDRLAPRLRDLVSDINFSLRPPRTGTDRIDGDRLLAALNGVYLLATIRDCRDSLALNELFDQTWHRSSEALKLHLDRTMDALRATPGDPLVAERLEAGIKMSEVLFGPDYAAVLRKARQAIERGAASA
jgi:hypothetical protein